ncbi:MAG: toll/interleukin-1 receptor domain-containing protein [Armatimonadota bacterium]|nr:toll/interleukin-1 receptor domain-containing protein [Armatimonadota bacterium]
MINIESTHESITEPVEVFFSYSHRDSELRHELETHLSVLKRQGIITTWHDRDIGAGSEWKGQIDKHLESAHLILLLVSANFLDSDYCYDIEMKRAMERRDSGEARVIPIILSP